MEESNSRRLCLELWRVIIAACAVACNGWHEAGATFLVTLVVELVLWVDIGRDVVVRVAAIACCLAVLTGGGRGGWSVSLCLVLKLLRFILMTAVVDGDDRRWSARIRLKHLY